MSSQPEWYGRVHYSRSDLVTLQKTIAIVLRDLDDNEREYGFISSPGFKEAMQKGYVQVSRALSLRRTGSSPK